MQEASGISRRDFIRTAATTGIVGKLATININAQEKGVGRTFKVALIGCGGRGFGFTGGHFHRNWQDDNLRKIVLNAIAWTAKVEVPTDGVPSKTPSDEEIEANQD